MTVPEELLVAKLDAAKRQLGTAIRLFFEERDVIAIHTLASAAQELLSDLLKAGGGRSLYEELPQWIEPEHVADFRKALRKPQNFFKHADRDPTSSLRFPPAMTEYALFDCVWMYQRLTGYNTRESFAFGAWFHFQHPDVLQHGRMREELEAAGTVLGDACHDKSAYLPLLGAGHK
jgi:hypothetical protein